MHTMKKKALALAGAATMAASLVAIGATPAMAATTPIGACGGGSYHEIDHHAVGDAVVHLLYNGSTNCVVTWRNHPGAKIYLQANIEAQGGDGFHVDGNLYTTYAGPVKVSAAKTCIRWGGVYGDHDNYSSGWGHCG